MSVPPSALVERTSARCALSAIGLAVGYYLLARTGLLLVAQPEGVASVWPASGLALAWFVLSPRTHWPFLAFALLVSNAAANLATDSTPAVSVSFAVANVIEALVAASIIAFVVRGRPDFARTRTVLAFVGASAVSSALAALVGAVTLALALDAPFGAAWRLWWVADGLGMLAVGAALIAVLGPGARTRVRWVEAAVLLPVTITLAAFVFLGPAEHPAPLLSLPYAPLLLIGLVALRLGPQITAVVLLLVSVGAAAGLVGGRGPFAALDEPGALEVFELQAFLGIVIIVALVTASEAAERRQHARELRRSRARYGSLIASMANGVIVRSASGAIIECNPAAEEILGLSREQVLGLEPVDPRWRAVREDGSRFPASEHPATVTLATGVPTPAVVMGVHGADGSLTWLSIAAEPLPGDDEWAVVSTFADVTARVDAQHEQAALHRLATLVASEAQPRQVFDAIAREAASALRAEAAGLIRFEEDGAAGSLVGAWMDDPGVAPPFGVRLDLDDDSAAGRVAATGAPARVGSDEGAPEQVCLLVPDLAVSTAIAVPIVVNGRLWGALAAAVHAAEALGGDAVERLTRLGEIASMAIISSDARSQLASLASSDHLTGLWNRRAFEDRLSAELDRARRHGRALSLIVMDLDHFKLINDTHGHPAGDRVLVEVARRLTTMVREGELLARVGGEEFAWILPETDGTQAGAAAERLRRAIAGESFAGVGRVTVAVGICGLEDAGAGTDLFRLADLALYWAKAQGRNRVVRYSPETIELLPADEQGRRLERAKTFASVAALARAVDAKDPSTQRHSERVAALARRLALSAGWPAEDAERLHQAALVHDVGKIAIPDTILLKPGSLTEGEYEQVKEHSHIGSAMLEDALGRDQLAWVRGHHERYDGSGYPDGLAGEEIPSGARLLALADAWDAMTVARPYGAPRTTAEALAECRRMSGSQFAPDAVRLIGALCERDAQDALLAGAPTGS